MLVNGFTFDVDAPMFEIGKDGGQFQVFRDAHDGNVVLVNLDNILLAYELPEED
jgi:hypothetical protein